MTDVPLVMIDRVPAPLDDGDRMPGLPVRPADADGVRALLSWAQLTWGVTAAAANSLPLRVHAADVDCWHLSPPQGGTVRLTDGSALTAPEPPSRHYPGAAADHRDYATRLVTYVGARLVSAALAVEVLPRGYPLPDELIGPVLLFAGDGIPVNLPSLDGYQPTADLWHWAVAQRGEARRDRRTADQAYPGALATAQVMHDLLQLLLPQSAAGDEDTAPRPRRSTWR